MRSLLVYYGWPSLINGSGGNILRAAVAAFQSDCGLVGDRPGVVGPATWKALAGA